MNIEDCRKMTAFRRKENLVGIDVVLELYRAQLVILNEYKKNLIRDNVRKLYSESKKKVLHL